MSLVYVVVEKNTRNAAWKQIKHVNLKMDITIKKYGPITIKKEDADRVFFTSDLHLGHGNINKLCNRPFNTLESMNEILIENWYNTVSVHDLVIITGDLIWGGAQLWERFLQELPGQKILIIGNHDLKCKLEKVEHYFLAIREQVEFKIGDDRLFACHYPIPDFPGRYHGVKHIYGHIHEKDFKYATPQHYNLSVERNGYCPISYKLLQMLFAKQINEDKTNLKLDALYKSLITLK
jgi:calcineurin-like phosphoesterase family protein